MVDFQSNERGSMTVEASIVIPVVILSILVFLNLLLLLYRQSLLQTAADAIAGKGALYWSNARNDLETGRLNAGDLGEPGLYWRLFDSHNSEKKTRIAEALAAEIEKGGILAPSDIEINLAVRNFIVYKKIEIRVAGSYKIPGASFLRIFGIGDRYRITAISEAVITDPPEFIRNMDFLIDLAKELENRNPGIKNFVEKIEGTLKQAGKNLSKLTGE